MKKQSQVFNAHDAFIVYFLWQGFTDELQRQDGRLQSTKAIGQKVTDAVKVCHDSLLYWHWLTNCNVIFIHSGYFYSTSSSPLLLRGAPNTAWILCQNQGPREGFEPTTLRTKGDESTNEPPRLVYVSYSIVIKDVCSSSSRDTCQMAPRLMTGNHDQTKWFSSGCGIEETKGKVDMIRGLSLPNNHWVRDLE